MVTAALPVGVERLALAPELTAVGVVMVADTMVAPVVAPKAAVSADVATVKADPAYVPATSVTFVVEDWAVVVPTVIVAGVLAVNEQFEAETVKVTVRTFVEPAAATPALQVPNPDEYVTVGLDGTVNPVGNVAVTVPAAPAAIAVVGVKVTAH